MNASVKIRSLRLLLLAFVLVGIALTFYGLFIGVGLPSLIVSVAGLILGIVGIIWFVLTLIRQSRGGPRTDTWRPGDESPTR
jgi:hypothetical protein